VLALAAGLAAAPAALRADPNDPVALVSGEKITEAQVVAELMSRWGYQVREELIRSLVVEQEAKKKGVMVTDAEIDTAYKQSELAINDQGRNTGHDFTDWLQQQSLTVATYRRTLRMRLLLEKMVKGDPDVAVTDEEVHKYYDANKTPLAEGVEVAFIAVGTKEEADQIRADILANKTTWDQAAHDKNLDPWGRDSSPDHPAGYLGQIQKGEEPIQKAAFALAKDGDISEPFQVLQPQPSWQLVKRISYQPAGVPAFETVQKSIHDMLVAQKLGAAVQQRLQALLEYNKGDIQRLGDIKEPLVTQ
jgi:foldase protein PrsA